MVYVAVIGIGIGRYHARSVERNGHNLAAVVGRDPAKEDEYRKILTKTLQRTYDGPILYDLRDLEGIAQAAIVAAPNQYHGEMCRQLLESGIHVMVEKPMVSGISDTTARDVKMARELVRLADDKGLKFTINLQNVVLAQIYQTKVDALPDDFYVEIATGGQETWAGIANDLLSHAISLKMALYGDGKIEDVSKHCGRDEFTADYSYMVRDRKVGMHYILRTGSEKKVLNFGSKDNRLHRYAKTRPYKLCILFDSVEEVLKHDPLDVSDRRFLDAVDAAVEGMIISSKSPLVDAETALKNLEMQKMLMER